MSAHQSILILGGSGQIGRELMRELSGLGAVSAPPRRELDLESVDAVRQTLRALAPTLVVNAAAYTQVDRAEVEQDICARMNAAMPRLLAEECRALGAGLVHFSTDYVFDGAKGAPYVESDDTSPLGVYGRTKRDGERAIVESGVGYLIARTSWVYAPHGRNFPATVLRLAREREELAVVDDQAGAPTSAASVASGVGQMLRALFRERDPRGAMHAASGIYHLTASGSTTWFDFARRILADDPRANEQICRAVRPVSSAEFPLPARRPSYSVLDNSKITARFGVQLPSWSDQWRSTLERMRLARSTTTV